MPVKYIENNLLSSLQGSEDAVVLYGDHFIKACCPSMGWEAYSGVAKQPGGGVQNHFNNSRYAPCHSCESRNPYFHQGRSGFLLPQE
jgi:hypothetical protein